jgi:hypothetical protein
MRIISRNILVTQSTVNIIKQHETPEILWFLNNDIDVRRSIVNAQAITGTLQIKFNSFPIPRAELNNSFWITAHVLCSECIIERNTRRWYGWIIYFCSIPKNQIKVSRRNAAWYFFIPVHNKIRFKSKENYTSPCSCMGVVIFYPVAWQGCCTFAHWLKLLKP